MDKQNIVAAVNILVTARSSSQLVGEITKVIENWKTRPRAFAAELEPLNSLIDIGLENRDAFEALVALAERKRREIPQTRRVAYQRDLMRERRARMAKAIAVTELTMGKLSVADRKEREKIVAARWRIARDEFIAARGDLSWAERNRAAGEYWKQVDDALDAAMQQIRKAHNDT